MITRPTITTVTELIYFTEIKCTIPKKLDEQTITNIVKRHIKSFEKLKHIKLIINYTRFKASNFIVKNNKNSAKIHLNATQILLLISMSISRIHPEK